MEVLLKKGDSRDTPSQLVIDGVVVMEVNYDEHGSDGIGIFEDTVSVLMRRVTRCREFIGYVEDVWIDGEEEDDED
jgi:hypothetical protein